MLVLTYVDGIGTVINGDDIFVGVMDKPDFVEGDNFYYEPTNKTMDDMALTVNEEMHAEQFIANFVFPTPEEIAESGIKYYVDVIGNYIGTLKLEDTDIEVDAPPPGNLPFPYWDGNIYRSGIMVKVEDNHPIGYGDSRTVVEDVYYVPAELYKPEFSETSQSWNKDLKIFEVPLDVYRDGKIAEMQSAYVNEMEPIYKAHELVPFEDTTFATQREEAIAYKADDSVATPLLDKILEGRDIIGETKGSLVDKVLAHAEAFNQIGLILGKYQRKLKDIKEASSVLEIDMITW